MCLSIAIHRPQYVLNSGVHAGLEWMVVQNGMGHRCGYVRVPVGHPWHGVGYNDVEPYPDVHGGLTFAEPDEHCDKGGEDNAWWFGFDCAHAWDLPDPELEGYDERFAYFNDPTSSIKTQAYVERHCKNLCEQAAAVHPVSESVEHGACGI